MALGATPRDVHALIFRQGFFTVAQGFAVGLGSSLILLRVLGGLLVGLGSENPWTIGIAAAVVSITAAIACWLPARRAAKVDPMTALRQE